VCITSMAESLRGSMVQAGRWLGLGAQATGHSCCMWKPPVLFPSGCLQVCECDVFCAGRVGCCERCSGQAILSQWPLVGSGTRHCIFCAPLTSGFFLFCACVCCTCGLVGLVWTHVAEFNWRRRQQHLLPAESANSGEALQPCPPTASIEARVLFTNKQFCFQMTSRGLPVARHRKGAKALASAAARTSRTSASAMPTQHDETGRNQRSKPKSEPGTPVNDQGGVMSTADAGAGVPARAKDRPCSSRPGER